MIFVATADTVIWSVVSADLTSFEAGSSAVDRSTGVSRRTYTLACSSFGVETLGATPTCHAFIFFRTRACLAIVMTCRLR